MGAMRTVDTETRRFLGNELWEWLLEHEGQVIELRKYQNAFEVLIQKKTNPFSHAGALLELTRQSRPDDVT